MKRTLSIGTCLGGLGLVGIAFGIASGVGMRDVSAQENKLAAFKADTKAKPTDGAASFTLGRGLRRAARWNEAKVELLRAAGLAKGEELVKVRYELALVELDQNVSTNLPTPPALATCKNVRINPKEGVGEALSRVCAGRAWLGFGRPSMAEPELAAAEKLDAKLYELKLARAEVDIVGDAHDDAIAKLKALSAATPTRAEAFYWLGHEYLAKDKKADALAPLKKARELDADWPEATYDLSRALPDGTEARDLARLAVAMRPNWAAAQRRLGELELATGGFDAAKSAFDVAIKLDAKVAVAHVGLAWAQLKLKHPDLAKLSALEAVKLSPTSPAARVVQAESLAALGETDAAVDTFQLAAGLDAKDPTPLVRSVEVLLAAKQPVKAEAHAAGAVKAFPADARCYDVLGDAQLGSGDKKSAKASYQKAISLGTSAMAFDKAATQKKADAIK